MAAHNRKQRPKPSERQRYDASGLQGHDVTLAAIAAAGVALSAYLLIVKLLRAAPVCPLGAGCEIVQSSRYANLFGVPVAAYGVAFYVWLLVLALRRMAHEVRWQRTVPIASTGIAASLSFTTVQWSAIHATCSLCLLSGVLTAAALLWMMIHRPLRVSVRSWGWAGAAALAAVLFIVTAYALSGPLPASSPYAEQLARHLASSGVQFYGAYWCPHCRDQKAMFGEAARWLPYIECDPRGAGGQPLRCEAQGIRAYPTWIFPSGQRIEGVLSLEDLARLSQFPPP